MAEPAYRALLIGNSTFPSDPGNLQSLEGPVNDIALLRDALTDPATGMFAPRDVRLLPERTMAEILLEMEQFFSGADRADRLLLFYSGHGLLTSTDQLLLAARDTRTDSLLATTVSATAINSMIDASAAMTTMIMLDCCYSGAFKSADLPRSLQGTGRYLLTSTRSGELARDADLRNGTSQFTTHLVEGLQAAPDHDGDGLVDLDDLYDYVHRQLVQTGRQIPQRNFSGGGDVVIARRTPAGPGPTPEVPAAPVLDVSETVIDLPEVEAGEVLSPERVRVVNRGGGRLDWEVRTDAPWVAVSRDGDDVRLDLQPAVGHNRANVVVSDRGPGGSRTIRVHVNVRQRRRQLPPPPPRHRPTPRPWWRTHLPHLAVAALVTAAAVVLGVVLLTGEPAAPPESAEVAVDGTLAWSDTGLDVGSGDRVSVVADGEIHHNEASTTGPEGFPNRPDLLTPYPELNHAALIGRIGEDGTALFVGRQATFTAERDGRLFLGVNDGGLENNSGSFTAAVTVEPGS